MLTLIWIILSGLGMSLLALVGLVILIFRENTLKKILGILVSFSAGSLLGSAFLHLLPEAMIKNSNNLAMFLWVILGFALFFLMEKFLNWHHCHKPPLEHKKPVSYMILIADSLHNFIGGIALAGSFLISLKIGIITWLTLAMHELPQELGDFGILLYGGWKKRKALLFNFLSALAIIPGGVLAFFASAKINMTFLLPFAAGNFIYIAASDLIPEIKQGKSLKRDLLHFLTFGVGILLILAIKVVFK